MTETPGQDPAPATGSSLAPTPTPTPTGPTPQPGPTPPPGPIRVMVVDDQPMIRMGLGMILQTEPDMELVAEASDGAEAVAVAAAVRPDVVLMDVRMPVLDGIAATRAITGAGTAGAVIIVTTFDDEEYLLDSVRAGAFGFLLKDAGPDLLTTGVRIAHAGEVLIDPSMTRTLLEHRLRDELGAAPSGGTPAVAPEQLALLATLTPREREVLAAVARGASNAEIAAELWVSEATVKTHISGVLAKTGSTSRVQAAVFAYESGFVRPGWLGAAS
jgi:DNA-binding NarL/FixJ family response regulator